jgi:hypothetical protein
MGMNMNSMMIQSLHKLLDQIAIRPNEENETKMEP